MASGSIADGERFANIAVTVPDSSASDNNGPPAPVASTGLKTSYAFGDDGDFQTGISVPGERFLDNNNGTFTDTLTDITWLGVRDCIVTHSWGAALRYANEMSANSDLCPALDDSSTAGEWRLPNIKELYSLVDISNDSPVWADGIPFTGTWSNLTPRVKSSMHGQFGLTNELY